MKRSEIVKLINEYSIYEEHSWSEQKKIKQYRKFTTRSSANKLQSFNKTDDSFDRLNSEFSQYSVEELSSIDWFSFVRAWQTEDPRTFEDEFNGYINSFINCEYEQLAEFAKLIDRIVMMSFAIIDNDWVYDLVNGMIIHETVAGKILEHALKGINPSRRFCDEIMSNLV